MGECRGEIPGTRPDRFFASFPGLSAVPRIDQLPDLYYRSRMKTLTIKVPEELLAWIETEARRTHQPKSGLVRDILQRHRQHQMQSALDLAADLCGSADSGLGILARNKQYLKGFGKCRRGCLTLGR